MDFGFPSTWFVTALALSKPLYWSMIEAPWGLSARDQLTVENQFVAFVFIAAITAALAALVKGKLTSTRHLTANRP